jgi:signal peptidase I
VLLAGPLATGLLAAYIAVLLAAGVVTGLKGKWGTLAVGVLTGIPWFFGAVRLAKPQSWWARRYYGDETMSRARVRAESRPYRALVAAGLLLSLLAVASLLALFKAYRIPSAAMEPTLRCARPTLGCSAETSDRVLALRFLPGLEPGRGDLVAFNAPNKAVEACGAAGIFLKRIVALPGENITTIAGRIVVDGEELREDYIVAERRGGQTIVETMTMPEDHYFMLGDNRATSCDSRAYGPVSRDDFIARVVLRYWPPSRIGLP